MPAAHRRPGSDLGPWSAFSLLRQIDPRRCQRAGGQQPDGGEPNRPRDQPSACRTIPQVFTGVCIAGDFLTEGRLFLAVCDADARVFGLRHLQKQSAAGPPWQVSGTATGATYRLQGTGSTLLRGSGCCCTYLPLVVQNP